MIWGSACHFSQIITEGLVAQMGPALCPPTQQPGAIPAGAMALIPALTLISRPCLDLGAPPTHASLELHAHLRTATPPEGIKEGRGREPTL